MNSRRTAADATTATNNQGTIQRLQLSAAGPFAPLAAASSDAGDDQAGDAGIASALAAGNTSPVGAMATQTPANSAPVQADDVRRHRSLPAHPTQQHRAGAAEWFAACDFGDQFTLGDELLDLLSAPRSR